MRVTEKRNGLNVGPVGPGGGSGLDGVGLGGRVTGA